MPLLLICADVIDVSGHQLSTAKIESALIMLKGIAQAAGVSPPLPCLAPSMMT
jgi:acyl-coenzyme A synthetase/AMP-(fatty) acid ligase